MEKEVVIKQCQNAAIQMRKDALKMSFVAGQAHLGGGLSLIEIMYSQRLKSVKPIIKSACFIVRTFLRCFLPELLMSLNSL